ncbi:replication initiator protein (plasmid) [Escherichia coli]|nr:replication initiator protein [Escherichia coli]PPY96669.1 replication initiator protein [Escherichia coli]RLY37006.1 replication initiator protein [Escherichia coli]
MGSCAAPSAKGDDKFITTDYLQQCRLSLLLRLQLTTIEAMLAMDGAKRSKAFAGG